MKIRIISMLLILSFMPGCATIHRHPKATAIIAGAGIGIVVGVKLGYQKPCPTVIDGYGYNGTPPCPNWCGPNGCTWPSKK